MTKNSKVVKEEFHRQVKCYFDSVKSKPVLRLPIYNASLTSMYECQIILSTKCCAILWIYEEYKLFKWIDIVFIKPVSPCVNEVKSKTQISYTCTCAYITNKLQSDSDSEKWVGDRFSKFQFSSSRPQVFIADKQLLISGLTSILRFLIKFVYMKLSFQLPMQEEPSMQLLQSLLGFRGGAFSAHAEVSVWTRFCEVDIFEGLQEAVELSEADLCKKDLSRQLFRFEYHLRKPVKIHNIRKETSNKIQQLISVKCEIDKLPIEMQHEFAEGPEMLLSDLILFPCMCLFQSLYGSPTFEKYFPDTSIWYQKMNKKFQLNRKLRIVGAVPLCCETFTWEVPQVPEESLYKSDWSRFNPTSRVFTRQYDVVDALESFRSRNITMSDVTDVETFLNWDEIPTLAHPEGGKLPAIRRERKCQQLSSMTVEVMKVVEAYGKQNISSPTPLRIVDFCSGGGHVGILLAWLLPNTTIILVENNEESLRRAWERVELLKLTNVLLYQCNLDYFDSQFEIGVALHACGTSTDLVLNKCIAANASFVCCPCCYGGIRNNHMLHYPRSCLFQESGISLKHYFILAHASDQTHDEKNEKTEQGKLCMQVIDTDRCLNAQENGYQVRLKKIVPQTASPKNHILIGFSSSHHQPTTSD